MKFVAIARCLASVATILGLVMSPGQTNAASVQYSIPDSVSASDAQQIRAGIRFAQDYVAETYKEILRDDLTVNVRASSDRSDPTVVAFANGDFMVVFTNSLGWTTMSPARRLAVIVHEFTHIIQRDALGREADDTPLWFIEGMAEYVAFEAVESIGALDPQAVLDEQSWAVDRTGEIIPPLSDLESAEEFQQAHGAVYSMAYLAVRQLAGDPRDERVRRFLDVVGEGASWREAFPEAFDMELTDFYVSFEDWVANELLAPRQEPAAFRPTEPRELDADVTIRRSPKVASPGELIVMLAQTESEALCWVILTENDGNRTGKERTHADPTGLLFWMGSMPVQSAEGPLDLIVRCGGHSDSVRVDIVS